MTVNWWTFLFQIVNFVVLAYVLHRLLYKPLQDAVDQRRQATEQARTAADKARQDAQTLQQQLQEQLAQVERQRQETIHQAHEQADRERRKLLEEAEQQVRQHQEEARQAMQREQTEAIKALHSEIVGQSVELARRLLTESADRTLQQQLILRLVETLKQVLEAEKEELRRRWQPADGVCAGDGPGAGSGHAREDAGSGDGPAGQAGNADRAKQAGSAGRSPTASGGARLGRFASGTDGGGQSHDP